MDTPLVCEKQSEKICQNLRLEIKFRKTFDPYVYGQTGTQPQVTSISESHGLIRICQVVQLPITLVI